MKKKIYFTVQDKVRKNIGYKTYEETCTNITYYREDEIEKAIKHARKRKANEIIMHCIEYLDDVPYVNDKWCFGLECYVGVMDKEYDGTFKEYIYFEDFDFKYYL